MVRWQHLKIEGEKFLKGSSICSMCALLKFVIIAATIGMPGLLFADGSLLISWDENIEEDMAGYILYYGTESCHYDSSTDVGNVTEHRVFGLTVDQTYYFVVTAYDQAGNESEPSEEVSETVKEPMTVASTSEQDVHLQWSPLENADYYNIYWGTEPYFLPDVPLTNVIEPSYVDEGRHSESKNNYYQIKAVVEGQESFAYNRVGVFNIFMKPDQNWVSLPVIPDDCDLNKVLGDQLTGGTNAGSSDQVHYWDGTEYVRAWLVEGTQSEWEGKWMTEAGDTLSSIQLRPDKGFKIIIRDGHVDTVVCATGSVSADTSRNIQLVAGTNYIGTCYPVIVDLHDSQLHEDGAAKGGSNSGSSDHVQYWNGRKWEVAWLVNGTGTEWDGVWIKESALDTTDIKFTPGYGYRIIIRAGHTPELWTYPNPDPNQ